MSQSGQVPVSVHNDVGIQLGVVTVILINCLVNNEKSDMDSFESQIRCQGSHQERLGAGMGLPCVEMATPIIQMDPLLCSTILGAINYLVLNKPGRHTYGQSK